MSTERKKAQDYACFALAMLALIALLSVIPSGEVIPSARNAYYLNQVPENEGALVHQYGVTIAIGSVLAFIAVVLRSNSRTSLHFSAVASFVVFLCSRIVFCLVNLDIYMPDMGGPIAVFRIWDGGLSFFGALFGLLLTAYLFRKQPGHGRICDTLAYVVPIWLFFVRLAEEWSGTGFGMSIDWNGFFAINARFGAKLNVRRIEMLCALATGILTALYSKITHKKGLQKLEICCYLIGAMQILLESLRYDRHMIWGFVKAEQIVALITAVGSMQYLLHGERKAQIIAFIIGIAVAAAVFGLEKALDRLNLSSWLLYGLFTLLICGYTALSALMVRHHRTRITEAA